MLNGQPLMSFNMNQSPAAAKSAAKASQRMQQQKTRDLMAQLLKGGLSDARPQTVKRALYTCVAYRASGSATAHWSHVSFNNPHDQVALQNIMLFDSGNKNSSGF